MIDPYADTRAGLQQAVADVAAFCMERWRPRIEFAQQNGAHDKASHLHRQMQEEISQLTAPVAKVLARMPPPPILITTQRRPDGSFEPNGVITYDG